MNKFRKIFLFTIFIIGVVAACVITKPKKSPAQNNYFHQPVTHIQVEISPAERFDHAIKFVLKHEGGLTNNKEDPGEITNFGISIRFLRSEKIDVDGDGDSDKDDIVHLDLSEADSIYLKYFWQKYHYDHINDLNLATKVFDTSVNMGANEAHKILKRSMNHLLSIPLEETGSINAGIISLVNKLDPKELIENVRTEEKDVYMQIVERNPHLRIFLRGWMARANE